MNKQQITVGIENGVIISIQGLPEGTELVIKYYDTDCLEDYEELPEDEHGTFEEQTYVYNFDAE